MVNPLMPAIWNNGPIILPFYNYVLYHACTLIIKEIWILEYSKCDFWICLVWGHQVETHFPPGVLVWGRPHMRTRVLIWERHHMRTPGGAWCPHMRTSSYKDTILCSNNWEKCLKIQTAYKIAITCYDSLHNTQSSVSNFRPRHPLAGPPHPRCRCF